MTSNHNMPISVWGPLAWDWFHNLSICYKSNPTYNEAYQTYDKIEQFVQNLPCPNCRTHATQYIQQNPINLTNSKNFQTWVWKFHNSVNQRTSKKIFTKNDYFIKYNNHL